ncbi:hypothetical protein QAD02_017446 [Eretmocerus hayati]|uniref:Uncharacterized protein n=1 Tax=Eretmocerus hayati TaxID=131215 RepID=A0ACC2PDI7_9HYME|nr:hypothetical protein QAD02_017446 [Eretmocerus hayati]
MDGVTNCNHTVIAHGDDSRTEYNATLVIDGLIAIYRLNRHFGPPAHIRPFRMFKIARKDPKPGDQATVIASYHYESNDTYGVTTLANVTLIRPKVCQDSFDRSSYSNIDEIIEKCDTHLWFDYQEPSCMIPASAHSLIVDGKLVGINPSTIYTIFGRNSNETIQGFLSVSVQRDAINKLTTV